MIYFVASRSTDHRRFGSLWAQFSGHSRLLTIDSISLDTFLNNFITSILLRGFLLEISYGITGNYWFSFTGRIKSCNPLTFGLTFRIEFAFLVIVT